MNFLPIQPTRTLLPMLVANGGPDLFEGIEIELVFGGLRKQRQRRQRQKTSDHCMSGAHDSKLQESARLGSTTAPCKSNFAMPQLLRILVHQRRAGHFERHREVLRAMLIVLGELFQ